MLKRLYRLMLSTLLTLTLMSGCGRQPQCQQDSDCPSSGTCFESVCDAGICKATMIEHCCGNGICESLVKPSLQPSREPLTSEDEAPAPNPLLDIISESGTERAAIENECTCPEDCGECEKHISYQAENGETVKTEYIKMQCTEFRTCEPGYSKEDQIEIYEFRETTLNDIVFNIIARYPNPLAVNKDRIDLELELVEINDPRILYPIRITSALALDGAILFGQNLDSYSIEAPDDRVQISIPIIKPRRLPEADHQLNIRLSLEYLYLEEKQVIDNGMLVYDTYGRPVMQIVRDTVIKPNLVFTLEENIRVMDLRAGALRQAAP
ncbi:MAG: hypothetical protein VBE63_06235 [Lamprobacter sp.]|uniref:hypothetical protein n=1 Tax=Lamprobacter sp. TaxID=3100796 RepID=UPI002B258227|nr:hypothetical protein [Lamprobacter sp.]MEA3639525.1 hypothetical protein [Lamprobacter sp.]